MAREDPDGLAGLHSERLVVAQRLQRGDERVKRRPVARGLRERRVHDEVFGTFADLEDVLEHAQEPLLTPAQAAELGAPSRHHASFRFHAPSPLQLLDRPRAISLPAATTLSISAGRRSSVKPLVGPATLTEAKICPLRVNTGAATALAPASSSSWVSQWPHARIDFRSDSSALAVSRLPPARTWPSPCASAVSSSCSETHGSITLPDAPAYSGSTCPG